MKAKLVCVIGFLKRYYYRGYVIERSSESSWHIFYNGELVEHTTSLSRAKSIVDWRISCGFDIFSKI